MIEVGVVVVFSPLKFRFNLARHGWCVFIVRTRVMRADSFPYSAIVIIDIVRFNFLVNSVEAFKLLSLLSVLRVTTNAAAYH
jgi:hypothetical protein